MHTSHKRHLYLLAITAFLVIVAHAAIPAVAHAQTDEIQVYDAEIEEVGKFNIMVHSNFTPIGRKTPDFPLAGSFPMIR